MTDDTRYGEILEHLRTAKKVTVLTGAGISAASGVPTFRGDEGLWRSWSPEDLATPEAFHADPALVWEWYAWRRQLISECRPNRGHVVLAAWSQRFPLFRLITQNVDGLHEHAGTRAVIRYHGSIWNLRCVRECGHEVEDRRVPLPEMPPRCPACGSLLRPGVVWFGEAIPEDVLEQAANATRCDVFLSVGTSSVVYPAAGLIGLAASHGAYTVEINPEPTHQSASVDRSVQGPAEVVLDQFESGLRPAVP